jgi:hypothetical protein
LRERGKELIGKGNQDSPPEALQPHYVVSTNGHLLYHDGRRLGAPSFSVLQAGSSGEQQESFMSREISKLAGVSSKTSKTYCRI